MTVKSKSVEPSVPSGASILSVMIMIVQKQNPFPQRASPDNETNMDEKSSENSN